MDKDKGQNWDFVRQSDDPCKGKNCNFALGAVGLGFLDAAQWKPMGALDGVLSG